ncbi:fatty acyl-AMP ligase [Nocardia harenae]|uniref:fatty acyl-AMP ligase n=1 Tax=Nocardia harenae TaxID=358707 RepID=UPI0008335C55|nr:fatty acyl-AMP ligase [Nocardia harenae]
MLLPEVLRERARTAPAATAYLFLDEHGAEAAALSYAGLDRRARAVAARLAAVAGPGERALLVLPTGPDFVAAFFGCLYAGVIAVPVIPPRRGRAHPATHGIVAGCAPAVLLTTGSLELDLPIPERIAVDEVPAHGPALDPRPCAPGDPAFLQYTSGSTGSPRGVVVTHGNLRANQEMIRAAFGHDERSTFVGWAPLYHDQGLIGNLLQPLYLGAPCVLMAPLTFIRRPLLWLTAISEYRAHTSGGPDFAFDACVRHAERADVPAGLDLSSWRVAFDGAEPIRAETLRRFAATFAPHGFDPGALYPCYGLAEATLLVSGSVPGRGARELRASSAALGAGTLREAVAGEPARVLVGCGRPAPGVDVSIVDPESGEPCPPGRIGEIRLAGANIAAGYWRDPEATAAVFGARRAAADGARTDAAAGLRTGDLGQFADGELYVTGRRKDLIIVRGRNHYPHDLEHTAQAAHPAARAGGTAAFTAADRPVLVQEIERDTEPSAAAAAEIAGAIRAALLRDHDLALGELVLTVAGALPKTSSGKIMRSAARANHLGAGFERWGVSPVNRAAG